MRYFIKNLNEYKTNNEFVFSSFKGNFIFNPENKLSPVVFEICNTCKGKEFLDKDKVLKVLKKYNILILYVENLLPNQQSDWDIKFLNHNKTLCFVTEDSNNNLYEIYIYCSNLFWQVERDGIKLNLSYIWID